MTNRIHVRDLRLHTVLGVHEWERDASREVVVNLVIEADLSTAARSDSLDDTVDYGAVCRAIRAQVEGSRFQLIEALAESIARVLLDSQPSAQAVTVTVDKPGAVPDTRSVAVELRVVR